MGKSEPAENGIVAAYMACRSALAKAVRRIVQRDDVDDVLQEAFVRSFEAEGRHAIRDARAFLLRTARNVALDHVSRAAYRTTGSLDALDAEVLADDAVPAEARLDAERRFLEFCQAVGSLPEQCRRVFVLKKVYGLTQDEVAARLGIAESTVEKHIARGLLLCHEHMNRQDGAATRTTSGQTRRA
jgi:RNA polymerase sigma-70 factor (ECF subfamily)